jgi:hypothetical protein
MQSAEDGWALPRLDFSATTVCLPIRHHSPACAWHVGRFIREVKPQRVLIEGPRDATALIPFLMDPALRAPVAIYTSYVERQEEGLPQRHGAYYPLCDYSPELVALRAGHEVGAECCFIDLTYPEMVAAEGRPAAGTARSLQDEGCLRHSALLRAVCRRVGARDHDDLWDCLYETDFRNVDTAVFFQKVLTYCALARLDYTDAMIAAEAHDVRESAMAAEIKGQEGRTVVVTGGFHTVALPGATPKRPPAVRLARSEDAAVTLMRYNFEQLDRLNGYSSGMPSPAFYQRLWEGGDVAGLLVDLARTLRERHAAPSTADAIASLEHVRRLAAFRSHPVPTREDLLDGVRSLFVKGSLDVEGVAVMAAARQYLAGDQVGSVPAGAGRPPLVEDFESCAARHRLALPEAAVREATLDLYRSAGHRETSRFFRRLDLLGVRFGRLVRGPDFVAGTGLERIQEVWGYEWQPSTEARLIEMSPYGATVEEAATNVLLEQFAEADQAGHRSDAAARLLVEGCRSGLHRHTQPLLERTRVLIAGDSLFVSVVRACEQLLLLEVSREPLEAHHLAGLMEGAEQAWYRAVRLLSSLPAVAEGDEREAMDAVCAWRAAADSLGETGEKAELRRAHLLALADTPDANAVVAGVACGLLYGDGVLEPSALAQRLTGYLGGTRQPPADGARFLRGVLRAARSVCWQVPEVAGALNLTLRTLSEDNFVALLPHLRLAFADLTPRECDAVAKVVAALVGGRGLLPTRAEDFSERHMLQAVQINARVLRQLTEDGLEAYAD